MTNFNKNTSLAKFTVAETDAVWVISANDLLIGSVMYMTPALGWSPILSEALTMNEKSAALSHFDSLAGDQSIVLGHTLVEASVLADGTLRLSHYRDRIRASGPTRETIPELLCTVGPT